MIIDESEITIRLKDDLPLTVPAFISESPDGHINIYINVHLSRSKQREGLRHELEHYLRDDLHNGMDIREQESDHNKPRKLPRVFMASELCCPAPKPRPPEPQPEPPKSKPDPLADFTPYQRRILMNAIAEFDRIMFGDTDRMIANMEP